MDKKLSAAALALAISMFGAGYLVGDTEPEQPQRPPDVQTERLLEHATPECVAMVRAQSQSPQCRIGRVTKGLKTVEVDVTLPAVSASNSKPLEWLFIDGGVVSFPVGDLRKHDRILSGNIEPGATLHVSRKVPSGETMDGWLCNGGFAGAQVQDCLNAALEEMAR